MSNVITNIATLLTGENETLRYVSSNEARYTCAMDTIEGVNLEKHPRTIMAMVPGVPYEITIRARGEALFDLAAGDGFCFKDTLDPRTVYVNGSATLGDKTLERVYYEDGCITIDFDQEEMEWIAGGEAIQFKIMYRG